MGISHKPRHKTHGITKADKEARKSDDLIKRNFKADAPQKCTMDITEIRAKDGRVYASTLFDCLDSKVLGIAMDTNMKVRLWKEAQKNVALAYPDIRGAIMHSN